MAMEDRNGKSLKTGDRVKYVGSGITTMQSDPRPDVNKGDKGRVRGEFSSLLIWVKFDKGGAKTQISRHHLEKI